MRMFKAIMAGVIGRRRLHSMRQEMYRREGLMHMLYKKPETTREGK